LGLGLSADWSAGAYYQEQSDQDRKDGSFGWHDIICSMLEPWKLARIARSRWGFCNFGEPGDCNKMEQNEQKNKIKNKMGTATIYTFSLLKHA
jgi:hypothetical protein